MEVITDTKTDGRLQDVAKQDLGSILWEKLKDGDYESAVGEIKEPRHHKYLVNNSLDLVPIITKLLVEDLDHNGGKCVEDLLIYIASVAIPKEALLVFLEELEVHSSVSQFCIMLTPIQTVLMRQVSQNTRRVTFSWVFNTLYSRLAMMTIPTHHSLEGKERKVLDVHPDIQDVSRCLESLVHFYEAFYHKVLSGDLVWTGEGASRLYLATFLLQLYHKPLAYLDIYCCEGEVENSLYRMSVHLSTMITRLLFDPIKLFSSITWDTSRTVLACEESDKESGNKTEKTEDKELVNNGDISQLSLACFFYCILGQHMASDCLPQIYSHQYIFLSCLPLIARLLQEKEVLPVHKGLILAKVLLSRMEEKSLPSESLEAKAHSSFPQLLIKIMVYCDNKEVRTVALAVFRPYFGKFDTTGRRKLIQGLLLSVKHAGVLGLVIHELKENVALSLKQDAPDPNFSGKHMVALIKLSCSLPDAEKTDLLEWSDCIMPALNLLIFTFVRDQANSTGIKETIPYLQAKYLSQIQKGLDLSRCHYELKLKELQFQGNTKKDVDMNVYVAGTVLPNLPPEQETKVVQTAICSLDMMQCVLVRATEAVEKAL